MAATFSHDSRTVINACLCCVYAYTYNTLYIPVYMFIKEKYFMKSNQHWPNRDCVKLLGKVLRNLFFSEYFECFTLKFHSTYLQRIYNRRVEYDVRPDKYLNKNKLKINETFQSFFWKYLENQFSCNCASTQTNPPHQKKTMFFH